MRKTVDNVNQPPESRGARRGDRRGEGDQPPDVLELVHAVMHLVRSQQFHALRDAVDGLTHMESKVLGFVARHPGATQSDLAAHSGRDKGQLARLAGALRERGLIEARADASDGRSQRLHLTAAGEAAAQAVRRQGRRLATVAVKGLSDDERAALLALLGKVRANLEAAQDAG